MPIKKSSLEKKWYYRVAKVFFLILPLLIALFLLSNKRITICGIPQYNILDFLQQYLVYIIIGLILYYLIINGVWRAFLYIVFGGLEDDARKEEQKVQGLSDTSRSAQIIRAISIIIILVAIGIFVLYKMGYITPDKININTNPGRHTCWATSAQMGTPCHSSKNGVGVEGVITYSYCNCPSDTTFASMDNITAGGPYKICTCN